MGFQEIEDMRVYQRAEVIADKVWQLAIDWPEFAKKTIGLQLVRAADSVGANIAEGLGRYHPADVIKFMYYSRGSMRETIFWLRRAQMRNLITETLMSDMMSELDCLAREINQVVKHQKNRQVDGKKPRH